MFVPGANSLVPVTVKPVIEGGFGRTGVASEDVPMCLTVIVIVPVSGASPECRNISLSPFV